MASSTLDRSIKSAVALLALLLFPSVLFAQTTERLIWVQENFGMGATNLIARIDLNGSNQTTIHPGGTVSSGPIGIDADWENEHIYWSERSSGKIRRSDLDGSNITDIITGLSLPWGLELDLVAGKIYWAELDGAVIKRANLDGTNVQTLAASQTDAIDVALDLDNGKVYFSQYDQNRISRMNLDGSSLEVLVSSGISGPFGLALDVSGGKMYFAEIIGGKISRSNLNGTGTEVLASGLATPTDVRLDLINSKIYWTEYGGDIRRANLNGTSAELVTTAPTSTTRMFVLDFDRDADGTLNSADGCPTDPAKTAAGSCGCGAPETDTDGDGTSNCVDACPTDAGKIAAGICGCGVADTDTDLDGTPNCNDQCASDPAKTAPQTCGCGVGDSDSDSDGSLDCNETCDSDPIKTAPGVCGCGATDVDQDANGIFDCEAEEYVHDAGTSLQTLVNGIARKANRTKKQALRAALRSLQDQVTAFPADGTTVSKATLTTESAKVTAKTRRLLRLLANGVGSAEFRRQKRETKDSISAFLEIVADD